MFQLREPALRHSMPWRADGAWRRLPERDRIRQRRCRVRCGYSGVELAVKDPRRWCV